MKSVVFWTSIAILALLLSFFDLPLAMYFYQKGVWSHSSLTDFLYKWGPLPTLLTAAFSVLCLVFRLPLSRFRSFRIGLLCFFLTTVLGSGLLIHAVFKEHWGRARPRQIVQFGGSETFTPFYTPAFYYQKAEKRRSFPSGHASCGFAFFAFAEIYRRENRKTAAVIWSAVSLLFGCSLGYARMAVGGHFLTDILVSAMIMYGTACVCAIFLKHFEQEKSPHTPKIS